MNKGMVFLVGTGPGDPGLLTLRGKELLETAEVLVYDRLASREFLELIPRAAKSLCGQRIRPSQQAPRRSMGSWWSGR